MNLHMKRITSEVNARQMPTKIKHWLQSKQRNTEILDRSLHMTVVPGKTRQCLIAIIIIIIIIIIITIIIIVTIIIILYSVALLGCNSWFF